MLKINFGDRKNFRSRGGDISINEGKLILNVGKTICGLPNLSFVNKTRLDRIGKRSQAITASFEYLTYEKMEKLTHGLF